MDLDRPFDLTSVGSNGDQSGTPTALIEEVRRLGDLVVIDRVADEDVLVEYPLAARWRKRLAAERFVQLRNPQDGAHYALVRNTQPPSQPRSRRSRRRRRATLDHLTQPLTPYPPEDPVGERLGLPGAVILAYQTDDQMHPPMVDDEAMWSDARRWPEGARQHVREAAMLLGVEPGDRILDIGCGIGGPARLLVDEFGAGVHGISTSDLMLDTAARINSRDPTHAARIELHFQDCQDPYAVRGLDAAWSMNMLYHVSDKEAMLRHAFDALTPGGRLMLEDWMLMESATDDDVRAMASHFQSVAYARVAELEGVIDTCGLEIVASQDLGEVGRTHMRRHFTEQFNARVRPRLEADFPSPPMSGKQMADEWVDAIETTIDLYVAGRMTYLRLILARQT